MVESNRYRLVERFQWKKQLRARQNLEIEAVREVDVICGVDPSINFRVEGSRDG